MTPADPLPGGEPDKPGPKPSPPPPPPPATQPSPPPLPAGGDDRPAKSPDASSDEDD